MLQPTLDSLSTLFVHALTEYPSQAHPIEKPIDFSMISDGRINHTFRLFTPDSSFFVKLNDAAKLPLFNAEVEGLRVINDSHTICAGKPLCCGHFQQYSYLLMEDLKLDQDSNWRRAGQQLAHLHRAPAGSDYGFNHPSFCGNTYQPNKWDSNWSHFFAVHRIGHQLSLLKSCPLNDPEIQTIIDRVKDQLRNHQPCPALLHGDMWSGNIGFHQGEPIVFDPAVYIGDPETDLAMSELFDRFPDDFYCGYHDVSPIAEDYPQRRKLYQLYHLLNHANLFGGDYRQQVKQRLRCLQH